MTAALHKRLRSKRHCRSAWLVTGIASLTVSGLAQWDPLSPTVSSMASFDGDPTSNKFIRIPSDTGDWTRHFRVGAIVGLNISANFSEHGTFPIAGNNPAAGLFDDGYVHPDGSGNTFGYTSNWGYNNSSQYNPATQTLLMHATTSYSTLGSSQDNGGPFPGFDMAYGDNIWYWKHARVGWELGFGLLPINIKDDGPLTASVNSTVYTFNTGNVIIPGPPPYRGGFINQVGDATIPLAPESITDQAATGGIVTGTRELNMMLYTVRLGPSFYWDLTEDFGMSLGAGPAVGVVTGNYKYNENVSSGISARNFGSFNSTDVVYGGYVNGTLMYHVLDNADFYLSAQYTPMGNANFSSGGRYAELNLNGQVYVSLGINWPF